MHDRHDSPRERAAAPVAHGLPTSKPCRKSQGSDTDQLTAKRPEVKINPSRSPIVRRRNFLPRLTIDGRRLPPVHVEVAVLGDRQRPSIDLAVERLSGVSIDELNLRVVPRVRPDIT